MSPTNTPTKSPAKAPAQAPAKVQTPRKKRARKEVAASPTPPLRPVRSCTVRAPEVDISVGDDRLSSGDEADFQVDEGDESDIEGTSETSAGEEEENTSDEEDAVGLSAGTPFDQMNKDRLSEHAKTGWTTYFEDSCECSRVLYRITSTLYFGYPVLDSNTCISLLLRRFLSATAGRAYTLLRHTYGVGYSTGK
ncbi:hypothetical protein DVH05_009900 [Phytophthora capsici]|nr:hypothetical protein DVH05_009900 [Phytophthora capsici]